jgi:hypothetical protein
MKRGKRGQAKRSSPKRSLNLPDLDQAKSAVLNSLPSKESQRGYRHAIDEFTAWYCSEPRLSCNKAVVARYRIHLESRQLAPGAIGNAGRNIARAPALFQLDLGLHKEVLFGDAARLQFRAEAFNVLNKTNFSPPNTAWNTTAFGAIK